MIPDIILFSPKYAHTVDGSARSLKLKNASAVNTRTSPPLSMTTESVSMSVAAVC
jgi:hypothetical protein